MPSRFRTGRGGRCGWLSCRRPTDRKPGGAIRGRAPRGAASRTDPNLDREGRCVDRAGAVHGILGGMRLGIADHFGWAVAITASADYEVVDRRQIELIEPGVPVAPIHQESKLL